MPDSNSRSADQARDQNIAAMGAELGEIYSALWQQLAWLYQKWGHFVAAYGTSDARIDIMNRAAPSFFGTVQNALWENVLLHLARLTDPASTSGKPNLSFERLCRLVTNEELKVPLSLALAELTDQVGFARDWRNRRIAHGDLLLALGQATLPLAEASRMHVKKTLECMERLLNVVSLHYLQTTTKFDLALDSTPGGPVSALYYLRAGVEAEAKRLERVRSGQFEPSDIDRRPI